MASPVTVRTSVFFVGWALQTEIEWLRELLRLFKKEFPCLLQSLQEAVVRGDMKAVEVTAHTMKGMLASVAFRQAAASAARLESMGKRGVTQGGRGMSR